MPRVPGYQSTDLHAHLILKHQYYNFEKLRNTSIKLSENKDHKFFELLRPKYQKLIDLRTTKFFVKEIAQMTAGTTRNFSKNMESRSVRIFCKIRTIMSKKIAKIKDHTRTIGTNILGKKKDH